jgi:hypothetical protein
VAQDDDLPVVRTLAELEALVGGGEPCYVRFSRGPQDDRGSTSTDYESGLELPGLSVNELEPQPWWTRPVQDWLARQLCQYDHLMEESDDERRAWVLTGRVAARGPDSEPLVDRWEPVAMIAEECLHEARDRYAERFDTGRDSTG